MDKSNGTEIRVCATCKRQVPNSYLGELCPTCQDNKLFADVRDYIRSEVVNEYMVAEKFSLPITKVRQWIKEGRIEYSNDPNKKIMAAHCHNCGKAISFGSICSDCLRSLKTMTGVYVETLSKESKMRFLVDRYDENK